MRKRGKKISILTPHHTLLEYGELSYWVSFESPSKTEQDDINPDDMKWLKYFSV